MHEFANMMKMAGCETDLRHLITKYGVVMVANAIAKIQADDIREQLDIRTSYAIESAGEK